MKHPYFSSHASDQRQDREAQQEATNAFIVRAMEARVALKGRRVLTAC